PEGSAGGAGVPPRGEDKWTTDDTVDLRRPGRSARETRDHVARTSRLRLRPLVPPPPRGPRPLRFPDPRPNRPPPRHPPPPPPPLPPAAPPAARRAGRPPPPPGPPAPRGAADRRCPPRREPGAPRPAGCPHGAVAPPAAPGGCGACAHPGSGRTRPPRRADRP